MDSVPIAFCRDVCASLGDNSNRFSNLSASLTGPWKAAFSQYAKNAQLHLLVIGRDEAGWWYYARYCNYADYYSEHQFTLPPHDEFLALGRRYVVFEGVEFLPELPRGITPSRCSEEDMVERLAPFIAARTRSRCSLRIDPEFPQDVALTALKMFRTFYTFSELLLAYYGPESEDFLFGHLTNRPGLRYLTLLTPWPRTAVLEKHIMKLLQSSAFKQLDLPYFEEDDGVNLRFTFAMFKIMFDAWVRTERKNGINVSGKSGGTTGVTLQDVLSMPVPATLTRTEKCEKVAWYEFEETDEWKVCWTKQDGYSLTLTYEVSPDFIVIASHEFNFDA